MWNHRDPARLLDALRQLADLHPEPGDFLRIVEELEIVCERGQADADRHAFLVQVTHELRTPLNGIIGLSELLQQEHFGALNHRQLTYVENILHSGRHLLDLVDGILDLSSTELGHQALRRSWMGVGEVVRPCILEAGPLLEAGPVGLDLHLPPDLPAIYVDVARWRQVVLALLTWVIERTGPDRTVNVDLQARDGALLMQVRAPGGGKPHAQADLEVTERIVAMHGGDLAVRETGEGPFVSLSLPLRPHTRGAPAAGASEPTVLLVNPRRIEAHLQASVLQRVGLAVVSVDDAEQARMASRTLEPVAVVVDSDDATTSELVSALQRLALAPIVLVSDPDLALSALRAGVAVHLHRPLEPDQLVQGVEIAGARTYRLRGTQVWCVSDRPDTAPLVTLLEEAGCEIHRGPTPPGKRPALVVTDSRTLPPAGSGRQPGTQEPSSFPSAGPDLPLLIVQDGPVPPRTGRARALVLSPAEARRSPQRVIRWVHRATGGPTGPRLLLPFELRSVLDAQIASVDRSGAALVVVTARLEPAGVDREQRLASLPERLAKRLRQDDVVGWIAPDVLAVVPGRVTYAGASILQQRFLAALGDAGIDVLASRIALYPDDGHDADTLIGEAGAI